MKLYYKNEKLKRICEDPTYQKSVIRKYGMEVAINLEKRIKDLKRYNTLFDVPSSLPTRRHKLQGEYKDYFAVNITKAYRLIFKQKDDAIIIEDLKSIKEILITEVSKHYE